MVAQTDWVTRLQSEGEIRENAIAELRKILVRGLSRSIAKRGGGDAFAEDIAQEALVRILDSLDSFQGRSKFTTWAVAVAVRTAITELRRRHFENVSLDQLTHSQQAITELADDNSATVQQVLEQQEIHDQLNELIHTELTDHQQTVVQAVLSGLPADVIADRLDTTRSAVYKTMHDARSKLRRAFETSGTSTDEIQQILAEGTQS